MTLREPVPPNGGAIILVTSAILSGLALGSMYGLIALGFHMTYVVSNTVNFSQGSSVMLGAVLGYTFAVRLGWPLPLALCRGSSRCAGFGLLVERTLVRPFAERGSNAWLMATVAGGIVSTMRSCSPSARSRAVFPRCWPCSRSRYSAPASFPCS